MDELTQIQDMFITGCHPVVKSSTGCGIIRARRPSKLSASIEQQTRREKHLKRKAYRIQLRGADLNDNPRRRGFLDLPAELRLQIYGYLLEPAPFLAQIPRRYSRRRPCSGKLSCQESWGCAFGCEEPPIPEPCCCTTASTSHSKNCERWRHAGFMASNRTIRDEIKEIIRSNTFTIKLPWAGKISADDDTRMHHRNAQSMSDVRTKIEKIKPANRNSVTTLVFTGAPWMWCQLDTDGPAYGPDKNIDNCKIITFPCMSVYANLCRDVFINLRHIRFHLDFAFDFRFRDAEFMDLLDVLNFTNLETIHLQLHLNHRWLPKFEARSLNEDGSRGNSAKFATNYV